MPGPYSPNDDILGPIIHQLAVTLQAEIPSIEYIYEKPPDRAPSNNQVLLPLSKAKILSDTNGKVKILFFIGARHLFRRTELDAGITLLYQYLTPWLRVLTAWPNATLNGLAIDVTPKQLFVTKVQEAGQIFLCLATDFEVLTEFNIPIT